MLTNRQFADMNMTELRKKFGDYVCRRIILTAQDYHLRWNEGDIVMPNTN